MPGSVPPSVGDHADEQTLGHHVVWVPNWSSTCDLGVFVYQPVEQIATSEVKATMAPQVVVVTSAVLRRNRIVTAVTGVTAARLPLHILPRDGNSPVPAG